MINNLVATLVFRDKENKDLFYQEVYANDKAEPIVKLLDKYELVDIITKTE